MCADCGEGDELPRVGRARDEHGSVESFRLPEDRSAGLLQRRVIGHREHDLSVLDGGKDAVAGEQVDENVSRGRVGIRPIRLDVGARRRVEHRSVAGESRPVARAFRLLILSHPCQLAARVRTDGLERHEASSGVREEHGLRSAGVVQHDGAACSLELRRCGSRNDEPPVDERSGADVPIGRGAARATRDSARQHGRAYDDGGSLDQLAARDSIRHGKPQKVRTRKPVYVAISVV